MDDKDKNIEKLVRKNSQQMNHKISDPNAISDKIKGQQKKELKENMRKIIEEVREYIDQGLLVYN